MLTKNGYAVLAAKLFTSTATIKVNRTDGTTAALYPSSYLYAFDRAMKNLVKDISSGIVLGTGSTPVTLNDTTISGTVISNFSYSSSTSVTVVDNCVESTAIYTVTNTGTDDFTVSEIALFYSAYRDNSSSTGHFMAERTVLDEPITIPVGGIGVITYTIRMNYPTT